MDTALIISSIYNEIMINKKVAESRLFSIQDIHLIKVVNYFDEEYELYI